VWGIVLRLHGTEVVIAVSQTSPSGHRVAPCSICLPPTWGSAGGECLIPRFLWD
jgi:hypothetical protein